MAELEPEEFQRWSDIYYKASTSLENREQNVDEAAELIEKVRWLLPAVLQLSIAFRMHQIILASQQWLRNFPRCFNIRGLLWWKRHIRQYCKFLKKNSLHCNTPFFEIQMHFFEEGELCFRRVFIDPVFFFGPEVICSYWVTVSISFLCFRIFLTEFVPVGSHSHWGQAPRGRRRLVFCCCKNLDKSL